MLFRGYSMGKKIEESRGRGRGNANSQILKTRQSRRIHAAKNGYRSKRVTNKLRVQNGTWMSRVNGLLWIACGHVWDFQNGPSRWRQTSRWVILTNRVNRSSVYPFAWPGMGNSDATLPTGTEMRHTTLRLKNLRCIPPRDKFWKRRHKQKNRSLWTRNCTIITLNIILLFPRPHSGRT